MSESRRRFLRSSSLGLVAAARVRPEPMQTPTPPPPPGTPPAFGTATPVGPEVTPATFAQAEKLVQVTMTERDTAEAAGNWRVSMAPLLERRVGPRKVELEPALAPYSRCDPRQPYQQVGPERNEFVRSNVPSKPLPDSDEDIAYAPVTDLSRWIETRQITSQRLTGIYLERLRRFDPQLRCVITLAADLAMKQAKAADAEIAAGRYRGPLHGIPWGAKDLLDTAGIPTTYGAEPFRNRIPQRDAVVVQRLNEAGAVLVAKLSLGALALNDVWFGGQTLNPWNLQEGSSGSSAGPGAATAAGLVGFSIGSETGGSIIGPSMRCGITGLRPTFGRVARTGAMTLCWSLDKLGPMARGVEDRMFVLAAISGPDAGDISSVPSNLDFNAGHGIRWWSASERSAADKKMVSWLHREFSTPDPAGIPSFY